MHRDETETIINEEQPQNMRKEIPELCEQDHVARRHNIPCRWDQERQDIFHSLRQLSGQMGQVLQRLAVGSERLKGISDLDSDLAALRAEVTSLRSLVAEMRTLAEPTAAALNSLRLELESTKKNISTELDILKTSVATYPLVKLLVFGGAGMILVAVFGALVALVVIKQAP